MSKLDEKQKLYLDYIFLVIGILAALRLSMDLGGDAGAAAAGVAVLLIIALAYFVIRKRKKKK